jgi:hypothetical protein
MIKTGKAIYSLLSADTVLTTLIGDKLYSLVAPEDTALPFVVYERSYTNTFTKDGLATSDSTIKFTVVADTYIKSIDISEAIDAVLNCFKGTVDTIKINDVQLSSGDESYVEGVYIQSMVYDVSSIG